MTTLLHQLGFSYKKLKGVPGKAKTEEQEVFIEKYNKVKEKGLVLFCRFDASDVKSGVVIWLDKERSLILRRILVVSG